MAGITDEDVRGILAAHSERPQRVDKAMGIGKAAGHMIKVREHDEETLFGCHL